MNKIIVGMSGGVDSAVAVYLLKEQGYEVVGVFLEMLDDSEVPLEKQEFQKAKKVASQLEVKIHKVDIKKIFKKDIIDEFTQDYKKGLTPNPCTVCNPSIKFKYLLEAATEMGVENVATGHYVKTKMGTDDTDTKSAIVELMTAKDESKDQSYFLYRLTQKELRRAVFPLGGLLKEEVKQLAKDIGLVIPDSESQDVCFLSKDKSLGAFLKEQLKTTDFVEGDIIDEKGVVVGKHKGLMIYTIGQRRGLDINGGPFYVTKKDIERNVLEVSREKDIAELKKDVITITNTNWIEREPEREVIYKIKTRYQMKPLEATVVRLSGDKWQIKTNEDVWAVAPGQSLVVYDKDIVIGGGVIE